MTEFLWDKNGMPHKGWTYLYSYDYFDLYDDYFQCEMCSNPQVRYVHVLSHPEYGKIRVGCVCAAKLTQDYTYFKEIEKRIKKQFSYKRNDWKCNRKKWTWSTKVYDKYVTAIVRGMGANMRFDVVFNGKWLNGFKDLKSAKQAGLDMAKKYFIEMEDKKCENL